MTVTFQFFTFILVFFAIISLWAGTNLRALKYSLISSAIFVGLVVGNIDLIGAIVCTLYLAICYIYYQNKLSRPILYDILALTILALGVGLKTHNIPGFHNIKLISNVILNVDSAPYSLWLNVDTAILALSILAAYFKPIQSFKSFYKIIINILPVTALFIVLISTTSCLIGLTRIDVKLPDFWMLWVIVNLLTTVLSEEALFRFFLQNYIMKKVTEIPFGTIITLLIPAIIATFIHTFFGIGYYILVFISQLFYGYIFLKTGRLEASITTHFSVNLIHFLFFSYPVLIPA
jgi:membrane protease YdiL (CAAX protease family)